MRVIGQPGGRREPESLPVVVREDLGMVGHPVAGQALDPHGGGSVLPHPRRPGDLLIDDVPNEQVPKGILGLTVDGRLPHGTQELLPGDRAEALIDLALVEPAHVGEGAHPECLAHDGGVVQERFPVGWQRVEPGSDHGLDGFGDRDVDADRQVHRLAPPFEHPAVG